ncbi:MAG: prolipoprotein diacylglyceryl transferase [Ruminococcus sp.]|nr:prolipoprotein diacylglyceryl transferase [Ruminococcus sp.]
MTQIIQTLSKVTVKFPNFGSEDNILKSGITIDNVLFKIPGTDFSIYWYGFLIAVGILIAMLYGFNKARKIGLNPDRVTDVVIGGLIGAVIGARAYYVIFSLDKYIVDGEVQWADIFSVRDGGLAIYGGLIGAIIVGGIVAKIRKCYLPTLLDLISPCFLIGQCIGRWGNFFNQEAFGSNTTLPWGMYSSKTISYIAENFTDGSVDSLQPVHPCFLYESLWCLIGFILLHFLFKKRKFDGEIFLLYIGWYGLGRFFIEGLRTDSLYLFNIRVSQLVAGTCVLVSIVLLIIFRNLAKRNETKIYVDRTESIINLASYNAKVLVKAEKKELKKKVAEAKETGEGITDITKEYEEKFGDSKKELAYLEGVEKLIIEKAEAQREKEQAEKESEIKEDESSILLDDEYDSEEIDELEELDKIEESVEDVDSALDDDKAEEVKEEVEEAEKAEESDNTKESDDAEEEE